MFPYLPNMAYRDKIKKHTQTKFLGYDHNVSSHDGAIWDMSNLTSDFFPMICPRARRVLYKTIENPNGLFSYDDRLYYVSGTTLYADDTAIGNVTDSKKTFTALGAFIVILPDKVAYNRLTGELLPIESKFTGAIRLQNGTIYSEAADANTIYAQGVSFASYFKAGDAVTISGCAVHPSNNKTAIIREIDGAYLRFSEHCFEIATNGDAESGVTISRDMPDMDFIIENENRLLGCSGDTIYASKLGDIFNWNVFDGVSTDSYAVQVGGGGDFTGAIRFLGYAHFFKSDSVFRVYGNRPSNFEVMGSASMGVMAGCDKSLCIAGETLFYLSTAGIVAYRGGMPQTIAQAFGTDKYKNAVGGSDGQKYYVSMENEEGGHTLFVYDTERNMWHKEDNTNAVSFARTQELYFLTNEGQIYKTRDSGEDEKKEAAFLSFVEFSDFIENSPNKSATGKLQLRLRLDEGATMSILIQYDSDGVWHEIKTLHTHIKRSYYLPIIPRRCDHFRIRINATGEYSIFSLTREGYIGSEM